MAHPLPLPSQSRIALCHLGSKNKEFLGFKMKKQEQFEEYEYFWSFPCLTWIIFSPTCFFVFIYVMFGLLKFGGGWCEGMSLFAGCAVGRHSSNSHHQAFRSLYDPRRTVRVRPPSSLHHIKVSEKAWDVLEFSLMGCKGFTLVIIDLHLFNIFNIRVQSWRKKIIL